MTAAQSTARESGMALGLGTVPDYVRTVLADHGLLGCMVEWFAHVDDSPNAGDPYADPATYRKYALASVTTHDLPPATKLSAGEHANEQQHGRDPVDVAIVRIGNHTRNRRRYDRQHGGRRRMALRQSEPHQCGHDYRTAADAEHAGQQADDHADNHQHHHAVRRFIQPTRIRPE